MEMDYGSDYSAGKGVMLAAPRASHQNMAIANILLRLISR